MTNDEMKANRFRRWHIGRLKVKWIKEHLAAGDTVTLTTYTKQAQYTAKHIDMFKATKSGAWVQSGKRWECIDGVKLDAWSQPAKVVRRKKAA